RSERLGGAWQTISVGEDDADQVSPVIDTEIACHVIEVFPDVYEHLAAAAGVPFVPLREQPIRIHKSGFRVRYFSRTLLLISGLRMALVYGILSAKSLVGRLDDRNLLINFRTKFLSFLLYQTPCLFSGREMEGPRDGFVDFMDKLVARCKDAGVTFRTWDVAGMTRGANGWEMADPDGATLTAVRVHTTTSTNLRRVSDGVYQGVPVTYHKRMAMVAEVPRDTLVENHTYVAFWKDPDVARISRIDEPGAEALDRVRFLVEFYDPDAGARLDVNAVLRDKMTTARIVSKPEDAHVIGRVDCLATQNVDQLPNGRIDTDFFGYFSSGNLAAGLAPWLKQPDAV
ncbi:MAG: hypothetical protein AAGB15_00190, partial [Pseudomonadota bacterium]